MCAVAQGVIFGLILLNIFSNGLVMKGRSAWMKCADDSKFGSIVIMQGDRGMIQEALTDLEDRTNRNGMKFNITECKVMHLGTNNMNFHYKVEAYQLKTSLEEKGVGVLVGGSN